jgi:hypothetical protein
MWHGQAASLMRYEGETAIVYVAGEELHLPKETWQSLPPYESVRVVAA